MSQAILFNMSASLVPGPNAGLERSLIGTITAAVAYGLVLALYGTTFHALLNSKEKRNFLLGYITLMLVMSTVDCLSNIFVIIKDIFLVDVFNGHFEIMEEAWIYPFSIWAADAFMV